MMKPATVLVAAAAFAALAAAPARAVAPADLLKDYEGAARAQSPSFAGFSAERGMRLFRSTQGGDWSCARATARRRPGRAATPGPRR